MATNCCSETEHTCINPNLFSIVNVEQNVWNLEERRRTGVIVICAIIGYK